MASFAELWRTNREHMLEVARANWKKRKTPGRPPGVATGETTASTAAAIARASRVANTVLKLMEDKGIIENPDLEADELVGDEKRAARAALREMIVIALKPGNTRDKIQAARTVLEWTRAKPASTVNTNLNAAEDFLAALLAKEDGKTKA